MSTPPASHAQAGKLAQLLAEVLVHHAPHSAKINAQEMRREVDDWLEGFEGHAVQFVAPFMQQVLDGTDAPAPVRALLQEVINPTAQFSANIENIFLWGIISAIIEASVGPFLLGITQDLAVVALNQGIARAVDPSVAATAAARGLNLGDDPTVAVPAWAYDEAAKSGVSIDEVNLLASIVGLPPALQELFELYRRGIVDIDRVKQGLREGDFRDDWIDEAIGLAHAWLTPLDFVRAAVQAQMSYDDARTWASSTGLDVSTPLPITTGDTEAGPDMFGLAFAIAGRPPGPQEAGRMANRGIIPWAGRGAGATSFEQAVAESDTKTKWTAALQALEVYVPPPRQVGTLLEHGAITSDQALAYWKAGGVPDALAQGYVYMTEQQHVGQDKLLAKGEITTAYFDGILSYSDALTSLGLLGFRDGVAAEILAIVDFRREIQAVNAVVSKISRLYGEYKISAANALSALESVGVQPDQAQELLGTWEAVRIAPIRLPSAAEIGKAVQYGTLTEDQALAALAELGYQPRDAAIVLSAASEVAVTPLPPAGTGTTG